MSTSLNRFGPGACPTHSNMLRSAPDCNSLSRNQYDQSLMADAGLWRMVYKYGGARKVFTDGPWYEFEPWIKMPANGQRLEKTTGIAMPALNTPTAVVSYKVPQGWDGIITSIVNLFTGTPALDEDSGDILWRIKVDNQYYVEDYGAIRTTLGALSNRYPLEGAGIRIHSVRTYTYEVTVTNAGLDPTGRIICSLAGWIYPVR